MKKSSRPACRLLSDIKPPPKLVRFDRRRGVVMVTGRPWGEPYEIPVGQLNNPGAVLAWVRHLCTKTWVTRHHIRQLLFCIQVHGFHREP